MNTTRIDATEDDLLAVTEALKLAAIFDDRAPKADKARIVAWAEKIHKFRLTQEDVLDGVQAFYDTPNDRSLNIAELLHLSRIARRQREDKYEDELLARRQSEQEAKAADDLEALSAEVLIGRVKNRTPRLEAATAALQECVGHKQSAAAIAEYLDARRAALKRQVAQ